MSSNFLPKTYKSINNNASIGEVLITDLINHYGTPLYVLDQKTIEHNCFEYINNLKKYYGNNFLVSYAAKANLNIGLANLIVKQGLGIDVVSGGELFTTITAGVNPNIITFNGNLKSISELTVAITKNIHRVIVDNFAEIDNIITITNHLKLPVNILVRFSPGIECHTHDYIKTAKNDTKFGFTLEQIPEVVKKLLENKNYINFKGFHCHIGSQIFEIQPFLDLIEIVFNLMQNIKQQHNIILTDLNLGGGWGVSYNNKDDPLPIELLIKSISEKIKETACYLNYPLPFLILEPGRSIVANAGITLYLVGAKKYIDDSLPFVAVDGGMGDNIRTALYQAEYSASVVNKNNTDIEQETVNIVGKYCESGDMIINKFSGPKIDIGDIIAVFCTGAYNYSMASNYNRFSIPPMVLVNNNKHDMLVKPQTINQILQNDIVPEWLKTHK
jgi:diaminopimelate decarboxylase